MILKNNPAIDVDELMKRVRAEAARIRTSGAIEFRRGEPRNQDEVRLAKSLDRHRAVTRLLGDAEVLNRPLDVPRRMRVLGPLGGFVTRVINYVFKRQREYNTAVLTANREMISMQVITGESVARTIENLSSLERYRAESIREFRAALEGLSERLDAVAGRAEFAHARIDTDEAALQAVSARANDSPPRGEVRLSIVDALREVDRRMADAHESALRAVAMLRGELHAAPRPDSQGTAIAQSVDRDDAFHAFLADRFRGSRPTIEERLAAYLPIVRAADTVRESTPLLDVGPGRGEWLALLRDGALPAIGVETNRLLADECRTLGLDVHVDDMLTALRAREPGTLGALSAFHVVEHLPFGYLLDGVREALRVLVPGGLLLFETPDPRNLLVASGTFYLDPTHRHPVPQELLRAIVEGVGFVDCEVLELHPPEEPVFAGTDDLSARLNQYFSHPQDYAIVARAPRG